jgi:hypothetical protein
VLVLLVDVVAGPLVLGVLGVEDLAVDVVLLAGPIVLQGLHGLELLLDLVPGLGDLGAEPGEPGLDRGEGRAHGTEVERVLGDELVQPGAGLLNDLLHALGHLGQEAVPLRHHGRELGPELLGVR